MPSMNRDSRANGEPAPSVIWSVVPDQTSSPYVRDIVTSLRDHGLRVDSMSLRFLMSSTKQLVHIQWPEHVSRGPSTRRTLAKHARAVGLLAAFKTREHKLIVTAHNRAPHAKSDPFDAFFRQQVLNAADALVVLVPDHEAELRKLGQVGPNTQVHMIRHPAPTYDGPKRGHRDGALLMLGLIHPYRQVLEFVDSLISQGNTRPLHIAGTVGDDELVAQLVERERTTDWLHIRPGYLPEDDLELLLDETAAVISLQRNVLNSGGAFFALSRGIPVALTESSQAQSLASELGDEWIYQAPQDPSALNLEKLEGWIELQRSRPDLTDYSADAVAREHAALYELLSNRT